MKLLAFTSSALLLAACASVPPPHERMASAEAAVRGAEEANSITTPQAELELKLARDGIARAKQDMRAGDNELATYALMRAEADAELAIALAHDADARSQAERAEQEAQRMQNGMNR